MMTKKFIPSYVKTYDLDVGRSRGIESMYDYVNNKDVFKPMILDWMRKMEYHYVYKVSLGNHPFIWEGTFGTSKMYYYMYPVFVQGRQLPNF